MSNVTDKITNTLNFYHKSEAITESLVTMFEETVLALTNELAKELDEATRAELSNHKLELEEILSDLRETYEAELDAEESLKDYDEMNELINKYL
tara:strand:+ start:447 stop:731 length:285 start_codon:yes stop_codon:yes gene_type:complete